MNRTEQKKWVKGWWIDHMRNLADAAPDLPDEIELEIWDEVCRRLARRLER